MNEVRAEGGLHRPIIVKLFRWKDKEAVMAKQFRRNELSILTRITTVELGHGAEAKGTHASHEG